MNIHLHPNTTAANTAAADLLAEWLVDPAVRRFMPASGNTPIDLYRLIGERKLPLPNLDIYTLDEYIGVPLDEPRNCTQQLRRCIAEPWGISSERFHWVSSLESDALASVRAHENRLIAAGGLDVIVLGLGQNAHLGFNEPGSAEDSVARVIELEPITIEANRRWFGGQYAPARGATTGLRTILAARRILIMAYGHHKAAAVRDMLEGPRHAACPASFLQTHPNVHLFLDPPAASNSPRAKL